MEDHYKKRLLLLADKLDTMTIIFPLYLAIGWKGHDGKVQEQRFPDYGQDLDAVGNLFPKEWTRNERNVLVLARDPDLGPLGSMLEFFGLEFWEYAHCFVPYLQDATQYGGRLLSDEGEGITPQCIAHNIRELVKRV